MSRKAFTLFESLAVAFLIGVLALLISLRFFSAVTDIQTAEAMLAFSTFRAAMNRCAFNKQNPYNSYATCLFYPEAGVNSLYIPDLEEIPDSYFKYYVAPAGFALTSWAFSAYLKEDEKSGIFCQVWEPGSHEGVQNSAIHCHGYGRFKLIRSGFY